MKDVQPITYRGRTAAACTRERFFLSDDLEAAGSRVELEAKRAPLRLERMWGQQTEAFTFTLPLAMGLRCARCANTPPSASERQSAAQRERERSQLPVWRLGRLRRPADRRGHRASTAHVQAAYPAGAEALEHAGEHGLPAAAAHAGVGAVAAPAPEGDQQQIAGPGPLPERGRRPLSIPAHDRVAAVESLTRRRRSPLPWRTSSARSLTLRCPAQVLRRFSPSSSTISPRSQRHLPWAYGRLCERLQSVQRIQLDKAAFASAGRLRKASTFRSLGA